MKLGKYKAFINDVYCLIDLEFNFSNFIAAATFFEQAQFS